MDFRDLAKRVVAQQGFLVDVEKMLLPEKKVRRRFLMDVSFFNVSRRSFRKMLRISRILPSFPSIMRTRWMWISSPT